jgi:hypothetical protein
MAGNEQKFLAASGPGSSEDGGGGSGSGSGGRRAFGDHNESSWRANRYGNRRRMQLTFRRHIRDVLTLVH